MKKIIIIFLLIISQQAVTQEIRLAEISKTEFSVGSVAEIITSKSSNYSSELNKNEIKLFLEKEPLNYQKIEVFDTLLKWVFKIPSKNHLVGNNKLLYFDNGTNKTEVIKINVFAEEPELISYESSILYSDITEYQYINFIFNNVSYVDQIEFVDKKIQIEGTSKNIITSKSNGFKSNTINNNLSINIIPNDCKTFDVLFYYRNKQNYTSIKTDTIHLNIIKVKKFMHQRFQIIKKQDLYLDDFENEKYSPKVLFKFDDLGTTGRRYYIDVDNSNIKLHTKQGTDQFDMPQSKEVEIEVVDIKKSGKFEISVFNDAGEKFYSTLNILPKPKISEINLSNSKNNEIVKDKNKIYSLKVRGEDLHKMTNVQIELVNTVTSQTYTLLKQESIEENSINTQIIFGFDSREDIPIGQYYMRLSRNLINIEPPIKRVYESNKDIISITYPECIVSNQTMEVKLYKADFFNSDSINKYKILDKNSPITLKISPHKENINAGPQYLKISAKLYKSDGNETNLNITEKGNDYITIFNDPVFIDLKKNFTINEFKINEKILVNVTHSPEKYGSNYLSPVNNLLIYRGSSFFDKLGITLSIPPYLATFRNVKRKTIIKDENGTIDVKYDGTKKMEFQSLTINAGLGFKFRTKNKYYESSQFALGLYVMGLDFANNNSVDEQKEEIDNYNFVARGSFNFMLLCEYSFINIENPNTRIPFYFGALYIVDPIDGGSKIAPVIGFGIDIKLFGQN